MYVHVALLGYVVSRVVWCVLVTLRVSVHVHVHVQWDHVHVALTAGVCVTLQNRSLHCSIYVDHYST